MVARRGFAWPPPAGVDGTGLRRQPDDAALPALVASARGRRDRCPVRAIAGARRPDGAWTWRRCVLRAIGFGEGLRPALSDHEPAVPVRYHPRYGSERCALYLCSG